MADTTRVFVLEDDEQTRASLVRRLEADARMQVWGAAGTLADSIEEMGHERPWYRHCDIADPADLGTAIDAASAALG